MSSYYSVSTLNKFSTNRLFEFFFKFFSTATVDYVEEGADDILMVCREQKVNRPPSTHSCTDKYCNTDNCSTDKYCNTSKCNTGFCKTGNMM